MGATLSLSLSESNINVDNNTSKVTATVGISWTYGSWNATQRSGSVTINGSVISFTSSFNTGQSNSGSQVLATKSVTVTHDSDGSKTVSASATYATGISSGTISASASKVLTKIPRASTPSMASTTMGNAVTIYTNRLSSSFTHTLSYKFGSSSGTIATGVGASTSWTPPISLANQIPSATNGTGTLTCYTYSNGTLIGTKAISFTLSVPTSVIPTISSVTITDTGGLYDKYGSYISGKSIPSIDIVASGVSSSTISKYRAVYQGITTEATSTPLTLGLLDTVGTVDIVATAIDSRNRTSASVTESIEAIAYNNPFVDNIEAVRCTSEGVEVENGDYCKATVRASITPLNDKNNKSVKLQYKVRTDTTWSTVKTWTDYTVEESVIFAVDQNHTYDIMVTATDDFFNENPVIMTTEIGTAHVLMDFNKSGDAIAIGKVSEYENMLEVDMPTRINHTLEVAEVDYTIYPDEYDELLKLLGGG